MGSTIRREPFGGLGDDARGVGLVVAHEHELIGAGERGAGGRVVKAGAAVQHERSDQLAQAGEQGQVRRLVELLGALGVGRGGGDHQPVRAAGQLRVKLGGG